MYFVQGHVYSSFWKRVFYMTEEPGRTETKTETGNSFTRKEPFLLETKVGVDG